MDALVVSTHCVYTTKIICGTNEVASTSVCLSTSLSLNTQFHSTAISHLFATTAFSRILTLLYCANLYKTSKSHYYSSIEGQRVIIMIARSVLPRKLNEELCRSESQVTRPVGFVRELSVRIFLEGASRKCYVPKSRVVAAVSA